MRAVKDEYHCEFRFWEPSTKAKRSTALINLEKTYMDHVSWADAIMLPRHILTIEFDSRYNRSAIQDKVGVKLEQQIDRAVQRIEAKLERKAADRITFQLGLLEQLLSLSASSVKCYLTMCES
jgi:hypothetical protein